MHASNHANCSTKEHESRCQTKLLLALPGMDPYSWAKISLVVEEVLSLSGTATESQASQADSVGTLSLSQASQTPSLPEFSARPYLMPHFRRDWPEHFRSGLRRLAEDPLLRIPSAHLAPPLIQQAECLLSRPGQCELIANELLTSFGEAVWGTIAQAKSQSFKRRSEAALAALIRLQGSPTTDELGAQLVELLQVHDCLTIPSSSTRHFTSALLGRLFDSILLSKVPHPS